MPRPNSLLRPRLVCQFCDSLSSQRLRPLRYDTLAARNACRPYLRSRILGTSGPRALSSSAQPAGNAGSSRHPVKNAAEDEDEFVAEPLARTGTEKVSSVTDMMTYIEKSKAKVLSHRGIPEEADVRAALQACRVVADYITDESVQPELARMVSEADSVASNLLSLDSSRTAEASRAPDAGGNSVSAQVQKIIDAISHAAYAIISYPPVFITPSVLRQYIDVQARLGKPETLPRVFQMYASKPEAQEAPGRLAYRQQDPDKVANAIDPKVIDTALDTAIEARNLDAAVGIIENSYMTKAYKRNKLLRNALLPLGTFAATPLAAYILASNFSGLQETMDNASATNVAFAGILAYVGFTASIGVVALTTSNDQMKRVTWAPGTPLRMRWLREEERAALDKIACAWGFRDTRRQGEEEGPDWDILREYIGQKGMVLDRAELMEGMD
ncbi:hypothetical protein F4780DRAFT_197489 [Xylariomycetidae sp. FL0641]|nr:hypothetical protein F4780DRAFT_197489 [Xylariomycetidae sp. FL0641]